MTYHTGTLGYNKQTQRFGLLIMDLWHIPGFHCGQKLEVRTSDGWIETRMEMSHPLQQWYLAETGLHGEQLEGLPARVAES